MNQTKFLAVTALIVGAVMAAGWWQRLRSTPAVSPIPTAAQLTVAASIYPLYDIVRVIAGTDARVQLVMPPGSSPHTYEPTPMDVAKLEQVSLLFAIGHGLDYWVTTVTQNAGISQVVTVDKGISLISLTEADPHYWLSPTNAATIAGTIAETLAAADPTHTEGYMLRALAYQQELHDLAVYGKQKCGNSSIKSLATFHNGWQYFAREFGLTVATVFEPYPGQEPTPQYVNEFIQSVKEHQLKTIYAEPQFSLTALEPVAEDLGVTISALDYLGGTIDRDTYLAITTANIETICR